MGGKGVAVTINSSGNWSDLATDSTDIILDGTASPITLNIIAHNYGGWTEGDTENSNFHDVTMTVKGDVTLTGMATFLLIIILPTMRHPSPLNQPTFR